MELKFKGRWFQKEIILMAVRWYVAYPLSYRQIEEILQERGLQIDHSTLNRWVVKYSPQLEKNFRSAKRPVGNSYRVDETYIKIKGEWNYLYRAVDKAGKTVDFLLSKKRDLLAAYRFLAKAFNSSEVPTKITIDKSGSNKAAADAITTDVFSATEEQIEVRQNKYLNNIVEQDHRAIKRKTRPMLGFKAFHSARSTIAGIELMHMLRKGQNIDSGLMTPAEQFYNLAG